MEGTLELAIAADSDLRVTTRAKKRVPLNNATEWAAAFNNFLPLMAHVYGSTCAQELYKFNTIFLELAQNLSVVSSGPLHPWSTLQVAASSGTLRRWKQQKAAKLEHVAL
jgi:hypothetical protein